MLNTQEATELKRLYGAMLKENTGKHFLDSGGDFGRHWQKNMLVDDFDNQPPVTWAIESWRDQEPYLSITISTFHYLVGSELWQDDVTREYNSIQESDSEWATDFEISCPYPNGTTKKGRVFLEGLNAKPSGFGENTYNGESFLSQVLQYSTLDINGDNYLSLQTHNGADVRGGYSTARLFRTIEDYLPSEFVYGTIDGEEVSTAYYGHELSYDSSSAKPNLQEKSDVQLYI